MNDRITLIKEYLNKEMCGYTLDELSEPYINQLCKDYKVDRDNIVGFFEETLSFNNTFFSSFRSKPYTYGLLFLEDRFLYNQGPLHGIKEMIYEDIKYVEQNIANIIIYTDNYDNDGARKYLKLSGLSFEEDGNIPMLMQELRNMNEDTIEVTKMEKYLNNGKKVLNTVVDMVVSSALDTANKAERELHKREQKARAILNNQGNYTQEQIEKAEEFLSEHVDNEEKLRNARGVAVDLCHSIHEEPQPWEEEKSQLVQHAKRKNEAFDTYIQYQDENNSDAE